MPAPLYLVARFFNTFGFVPTIIRPSSFNEKILSKQLFDRNPMMQLTSDKLQAREFVRSRIGDDYVPKLLCVWNSADEIAMDPDWGRAVLKANHGSGFNKFVANTKSANIEEMRRLAATWMATNYGRESSEWAYNSIVPRVFAEEWIGENNADEFIDYKILCFEGIPRIVKLLVGMRGSLRYCYCDVNLKPIDIADIAVGRELLEANEIDVPSNFSEMLRIAACLSASFDFLRVDLYNIQGRIFVGELTHYPNGGIMPLRTPDEDRYLGSFWERSSMSYLPRSY